MLSKDSRAFIRLYYFHLDAYIGTSKQLYYMQVPIETYLPYTIDTYIVCTLRDRIDYVNRLRFKIFPFIFYLVFKAINLVLGQTGYLTVAVIKRELGYLRLYERQSKVFEILLTGGLTGNNNTSDVISFLGQNVPFKEIFDNDSLNTENIYVNRLPGGTNACFEVRNLRNWMKKSSSFEWGRISKEEKRDPNSSNTVYQVVTLSSKLRSYTLKTNQFLPIVSSSKSTHRLSYEVDCQVPQADSGPSRYRFCTFIFL
ncbi:hypothetical protein BDF21DRAFT_396407 [Thamnidium elegans]|nr:hypothetical protein BDF21DRAFT_396407 [Thamnidium elegans]